MLKLRLVVLDIEDFLRKKSDFMIEELSVCTHNCSDTVSFRPPSSFNILSSSEQRAYTWVSKFLHGLAWESGDYPYCYWQQFLQNIRLRFPFAEFYAKGTEKMDTLKKLIQDDAINLETFLCPMVENLKLYRDIPICDLHAVSCLKRQRSKHCATKKAKLFYQWLTNESSFGKINSIFPSNEFFSKFDSLQLHNGGIAANCCIY